MTVALNTLQNIRQGILLDQLSVAIHDAVNAVQHFGKPAEIIVKIGVLPMGTKGVSDAVAFTGEVSTKLPKPELEQTLFFVDANGNPTTNQERTRQRSFDIATAPAPKEDAA